ncbi:MAG: hypothetical protein LUF26_01530, partial [Firmicutes bacterium]|nr:hypothetical protein [Bacillota bacterium]
MKKHYQKLSAVITAGILICLAAMPAFAEYDDYSLSDDAVIAEVVLTIDVAEGFALSDDADDYSLDGLYASTKATNTYKTVTISANSIESWIKKVKQSEANMTGFGKLVTDVSGKQTYTGKVITNRKVLE